MEKFLVEYGIADTVKDVNEWKSLGYIEAGTPYDAALVIYNKHHDELFHAIFRVMHDGQYMYYSFSWLNNSSMEN